MEKKKTSQNTIKPKIQPKVSVFSEDFMSSEMMWMGEERLKKFAAAWKNNTLEDKTIRRPYVYPVSIGLDPDTVRRWIREYDFMQTTYNTVKEIIYFRESVKLDDANPNHISKMLPDLSPEYKEQYQWQAGLRNQNQLIQETHNPIQNPLDDKVKS